MGSNPLPDHDSGSGQPPSNKKARLGHPETDEVPALGHLAAIRASDAQIADIRLNGNTDIYRMSPAPKPTVLEFGPPPSALSQTAGLFDPVLSDSQQLGETTNGGTGFDAELVVHTETETHRDFSERGPEQDALTIDLNETTGPSILDQIDLDDPETWHLEDPPSAFIDGAIVYFVSSAAAEATIVFASDELAKSLSYAATDLVGQPIRKLVGPSNIHLTHNLMHEATTGGGTEGETHLGSLLSATDRELAVLVSYSAIPGATGESKYIVALYRGLTFTGVGESPGHAGLLGSLAHGSSLGSLCYDVAEHVEGQLDSGSECWVGVSSRGLSDDAPLEPLVTMGARKGLVKRLLAVMFGTGDLTSARCALVEDLPPELCELAQNEAIQMLWGFPAVNQNGDVNAAIIVARSTVGEPSAEQQATLSGLASLISRASDHQRSQVQRELATSHALYDQLTRLPNRSLLLDRLAQATARLGREQSPLAVLMIDIDNFRAINNTYGATLGDEILIEVAARIHNSVRLGDTVGRIGSDQFVLICVATNGDHDVAGLARRISRSISEAIKLDDGTELFLTASIGVVVVDDDQVDPTEIIGQAESAMMTAMQSGRGHYAMFNREHQRHNAESQTLEQALHKAITNGELLLHYQPVFGLDTGQMVGAEALVRWTHPEEGLISPAAFMDLAEESGLIVPMGDWIINQAAEASANWPVAHGRFPIVTVNLSARQMADPGLVPTIEAALRRHNLAPSRLGFEITESAQIDDLNQASETLRQITSMGCRVAIDDFGIGHATLDYLRRFSMASAIKIDRSFTKGLATAREDAAIVAASIAMASSLGMQVVAEGVETNEQLLELRRLGCHYAQGFLLSRPVAIEVAQKIWLIDTEDASSPVIF